MKHHNTATFARKKNYKLTYEPASWTCQPHAGQWQYILESAEVQLYHRGLLLPIATPGTVQSQARLLCAEANTYRIQSSDITIAILT